MRYRRGVLIEDSDLPEGWRVVPTSTDESERLEAALTSPEDLEYRDPERFQWVRIRHQETGEVAWLRIHSGEAKSVTISGIVFMPPHPGDRVNNRTLRALPLAGIENDASSRRVRQLILAAFTNREADVDWSPLEPLGNPRTALNFYSRVGVQFMALKEAGEERPVARMVEINDRPAKTVQGWVTEARRRGFLPPGRQGKAG
jgi:hypothetical protein